MRVKIQSVGEALHPSELVVEVKTAGGNERLVVDKRSVAANSISVGSPIAQKGDSLLVELPRETMTGTWRVWVKRSLLIDEPEVRFA